MYRRYTLPRLLHAIHHRPNLRYLFYLTLLVLVFYLTFYIIPLRRPSIIISPYKEPEDAPPHVWANRATQVKQAFLHAYHGYEAYAAPFDELRPLSNSKINNFNGWGVTAFDSLDTMLLMGLQDEYSRALDIVRQANFTHSETVPVPYFETIIRYLGGLLSAYAFSKDSTLIKRAEDLVTKLEPVFNTQSGMPYFGIDPSSNKTYGPNIGILAEVASLQLEYYYLAKLTGKKRHFKHADNVMHALSSANVTSTGGMFPVRWNLTSGEPFDTRLSVGAQADSAHEYLLKHYLMTAKGDKKSLEMYIRATTHIITDLLYLSPTRHLLYVTDTTHPTNESRASASHLFEHLSCFLPGLFALGAHSLPLDDLYLLGIDFRSLVGHKLYGFAGMNHERLSEWNLKQLHMWAAEGLAQTCWLTYADQPSGLGPDEMIMFNPGKRAWDSKSSQWVYKDNAYLWLEALEKWKRTGGRGPPPGVGAKSPIAYYPSDKSSQRAKRRDYLIRKSGYLLRPETVESLYILWRVTGNYKWRVRGWEIFKALKRETMTTSGFASLESVEMTPAPKADSMPSYFMAETLKYLYLMFLNEDPVPLDKFVFNTEAHPFPIFKWTEEEIELFSE